MVTGGASSTEEGKDSARGRGVGTRTPKSPQLSGSRSAPDEMPGKSTTEDTCKPLPRRSMLLLASRSGAMVVQARAQERQRRAGSAKHSQNSHSGLERRDLRRRTQPVHPLPAATRVWARGKRAADAGGRTSRGRAVHTIPQPDHAHAHVLVAALRKVRARALHGARQEHARKLHSTRATAPSTRAQ